MVVTEPSALDESELPALSVASALFRDALRRASELRLSCVSFTLDGATSHAVPAGAFPRMPLEDLQPIRRFAFFTRQRRNPGWYAWSAASRHVPYESRLELAHVMLADFDPMVVAATSQPFRIHYRAAGRSHTHVPDYLLQLRDGAWRVINVTLPRRLERPAIAERLAIMSIACKRWGWDYRVLGVPDSALLANVRLLASCKRPPWGFSQLAPTVLARANEPLALGHLESLCGPVELVRPVILHLLWRHELDADLGVRLSPDTLIWRAQ